MRLARFFCGYGGGGDDRVRKFFVANCKCFRPPAVRLFLKDTGRPLTLICRIQLCEIVLYYSLLPL